MASRHSTGFPLGKDALTFWPGIRRLRLSSGAIEGRSERDGHRQNGPDRDDSRPRRLPDGRPASGIDIHAFGSGQGMDNGQDQARQSKMDCMRLSVSPREAYAVYVDDKDWAAPSRLDIVVREGKPAEGS